MGYLGNKPADSYLTLEKQTFTTSATDTYSLDREVSSVNDIELFLNNVRQEPTEAYTISGTTLTLASAITSSDSMYCIYQGRAVGTQSPAVGSVTNDMLVNSSITLNGSAVSLGGSATVGGTNTPAFSARETSQQTILHNTTTNLTFGTEEVDTDSAFASNQFTVPTGKGGIYYLEAQLNLYDNGSNISQATLWIWKGTNSTKLTNLYTQNDGSDNTSHRSLQVSCVTTLVAGDVIGCACISNTTDGGDATSYGGDNGSRFMGFKLIT
jgi:hypothetical protein